MTPGGASLTGATPKLEQPLVTQQPQSTEDGVPNPPGCRPMNLRLGSLGCERR